jgi:hypothetical protein
MSKVLKKPHAKIPQGGTKVTQRFLMAKCARAYLFQRIKIFSPG